LRRLALSAPFRAVVAVPRWRVSTREAFARIDRRKYGLTSWPLKLRLANALERFNVQAPRSLLIGNTFEKALGNRQREFEQLRACLLRAGASVARLTGSGSAVFGILPPGVSAREVAGRFTGSEALYEVRSARSGLRLRPQP
jgi:4-diphosphocytidyl-2C-methyl-D-erythritol kinase